MTITLFVALLVVLSVAVSFLTEAVKKLFEGTEFMYSTNVVVLMLSIAVGIGGTAITYIFLSIPFTLSNVICMILMTVAVWVGSMIGYDKVIQMIEQIKTIKK